MTNKEMYIKTFETTFEVDESILNESFTFENNARWDSLGHMTLIDNLENNFGIFLETEEILNFQSFENGKKILENHSIRMDDEYGK